MPRIRRQSRERDQHLGRGIPRRLAGREASTGCWERAPSSSTTPARQFARPASPMDITERKQAEAALRESEERFQQYGQFTRQVTIWIVPVLDKLCTFFNKVWLSRIYAARTMETGVWQRPCDQRLVARPDDRGAMPRHLLFIV